MSFTSLESRLGGLPVIISGPILRRVEKNSVTVWFASKQSLEGVVLEVFHTGRTGAVLVSSPGNTVMLGKNLHVLAITASSGDELIRGTTYTYDLTFPGLSKSLPSPGIVAINNEEFRENFCYPGFNVPSFVLPADVTGLNIVQGSCRKPHGGETDALRGLDSMLDAHPGDTERPQMLFLTGDQIYADDVSDTLLYMLMDASNSLLKWGAGPAYTKEDLPGEPSIAEMKPGNRQNTVAPNPDESRRDQLTSSHAKSHLITLGEFYCMYLFSWSDSLWPAENDLPSFAEVYPGVNQSSIAATPYCDNCDSEIDSPTYRTYINETRSLKHFIGSLHFIRKAMANIATYMIFDDHEITDDWFLTKEWTNNTLLPDTLTRRIIQNGMAAYAVFQAWGNTPDQFKRGHANELLTLLSSLETEPENQEEILNNIGAKVLPSLQNNDRHLSGSLIDWHYSIEFDDFRLVVIDTRTQRGFPSNRGSPALLSGASLNNQLPNRNQAKSLTLLVSPAPVFGDVIIESVQDSFGGLYSGDREPWGFNRAAFETFLHHIASYEKVVILSGDVHYGFTVAVRYWNERGTGLPRSTMVQLCSSSLKNSDDLTHVAGWRLLSPSSSEDHYQYITWASSGSHYTRPFTHSSSGRASMHAAANEPIRWADFYEVITAPEHQPQSRYELNYSKDDRSQTSRRPGSVFRGSRGTTAQQQAGYRQRHRAENGHRTIVGRDTISVITFNWPEEKVIHTFWFVPDGFSPRDTNRTLLQPYTIHEASLVIPTNSENGPGA